MADTGGPPTPLVVSDGGVDRVIDAGKLAEHAEQLALAIAAQGRRVLLVPPDHTRLHARAGELTVLLRAELTAAACEVGVLPALGTHVPLGDADAALLFGGRLDASELLVHDWRAGLAQLGEIDASEVAAVTGGCYAEPIEVAVDAELFAGWDVVVSLGQVVPHEVVGMANFTKNLVIGLGGDSTIHRTHFVGALCGLEAIVGRPDGPVRWLLDTAFDRFIAPRVSVLWVLTVVADTPDGPIHRGLFAGWGRSTETGGAAFRAAAKLAQEVNIEIVAAPLDRVVCWLDPLEFHSTWLGNKAVYRTRMAIADRGELVVLAPGVERFGEDPQIDVLIRRHGYRSTSQILAAVEDDPDLASRLSAAAHLIHGSSEGRFRVVYCTDPGRGGLTQEEIESVGYEWRPLDAELERLGVGPHTATGPHADRAGREFFFVANPALGLWATADHFSAAGPDPP